MTYVEATGRIVVVGGANTDILGVSDAALLSHDKNPGHVTVSGGGVGRNIAENLARLGVDVELLTAFGGDSQARVLAEECRASGIGTSGSLVLDDVAGSRYLAVVDHDGDMVAAVSDMRALDRLTPEALAERRELLDSADLVVLDANLPADSLAWIAENVQVPLLLDPVSVAKAPKMRGLLGQVHTLKANESEAGKLADVEVVGNADVERVAGSLLAAGVACVFITRGERGTYAAEDGRVVQYPAPEVEVVNTTGAGDAFTAGVAFAMLAGYELEETCAIGSAMAALALADERTVSERVSLEALGSALGGVEA